MSASLPVGALFAGRYTIDAPAGSGGMGAVYQARDASSGKMVAIKILHPDGGGEQDRFSREIQILAGLHHPGIVSYLGHGVSETGRLYLVMEWLDGEDLAQRLRRGQLSVAETITLFQRLAQALAVAHQRRIVHRDLKPSKGAIEGEGLSSDP